MAQTVIGMFDNAAEAQQAVQELTSRGFSRSSIDVSNPSSLPTASSASSSNSEDDDNGITKFFKSLFSDDSDKYTAVATRSQSIVTVHAQTEDEAEDAADILDDCGAVDVDERAASYGITGAGASNFSADNTIEDLSGTRGTTGYNTASAGEATKIPIIEENLEVGKREVLKGGVRLRSRIVERPVEESLRLREESVHIERTPVNRAATSDDLSNFRNTEIEMTETAEVPVVSKEARVVEEVSLGKEVNERTETISDTVRKTEVDVDNLDTTTERTGYSSTTNSGSGL
ncbi:MAG: hypothetical protein JWQ40_1973 [Segetibacter sp.]|nr:hypothetical protein [Segetibacter sp.]